MPRLDSASLTAAVAAACLVSGCAGTRPQSRALSGARPNIVFVFSDDHAPHAISAYGSKLVTTPNLDRLARDGVLFRNCFCGNSICGPSRATVLTGKHSHANGFLRNGNRFDGSQTTFPKLLQQAGYTTAILGKWHLGTTPTGFDHWMVLPGQGQYYNPDFLTAAGRQRIEGYCTEITTDLALRWLESGRDRGKPFLLMCQHKAPHRSWMPGPAELALFRDGDIPEPATLFDDYSGRGPATHQQAMEVARHLFTFYDLKLVPNATEQADLTGPDKAVAALRRRMTPEQLRAWDAAFADENRAFRANPPVGRELVRWKYQRYIKNYLRCVVGVDKSVGKLLDYIDRDPQLRDNTIVVYSSDQGFYLGDHGWYDKRWMYEESLRMPLLVRWPGKVAGGRRLEALVQNIDFAPTFLALAGVTRPPEMHGASLLPLLEGKTAPWRDAIYYHYYESHATHSVAAHYGIRTDRYKLIRFYEPEHRYTELFDLARDPHELRSVYGTPDYQQIAADLEQRLVALRSRYGDDTGDLGGCDVAAGIAGVQPVEGGARLRVRGDASAAYLLTMWRQPITGRAALRSTVQPRTTGEAMLVITSGDPRRQHVRCGVDFGKRQLVIRLAGGRRVTQPLDAIPREGLAMELRFDVPRHTVELSAGGKTLRADLPRRWSDISSFGYGTGDNPAEFTPIQVER
ncbi:MAG: sulfatase [Planctomycetes bacterium]|nr:sulfatase [Planctomycetota bacterium]MCB9871863.1 sulfatase [Planctomycetota bacterium]